jgi:hypothetical protein
LLYIFSLYWYDGWGYTVAFTWVLTMYQIYHTWIHPLYSSLLSSSLLIPGIVSTGIIFAFTHICTRFLHHIHPPTPFCHHLPLSRLPALPPEQDLFHLPVLNFVEEKREKRKWKTWHFSLSEIKAATQGVSLWYFHVDMYYNPNWFISSNFLHSTLVPFLW